MESRGKTTMHNASAWQQHDWGSDPGWSVSQVTGCLHRRHCGYSFQLSILCASDSPDMCLLIINNAVYTLQNDPLFTWAFLRPKAYFCILIFSARARDYRDCVLGCEYWQKQLTTQKSFSWMGSVKRLTEGGRCCWHARFAIRGWCRQWESPCVRLLIRFLSVFTMSETRLRWTQFSARKQTVGLALWLSAEGF